MKKVYTYNELNELLDELARWRDLYDVGITGIHGQPIHAGHIDLLREANKKCGILIVALNSDESSRCKSGYCFLPFEHRAAVLESCVYVDFVIENPNNSMCEILQKLPAKRYFKGGDITEENIYKGEKDACLTRGIEIVYGVGGKKTASSSNFLFDYVKWYEQNRIGTI